MSSSHILMLHEPDSHATRTRIPNRTRLLVVVYTSHVHRPHPQSGRGWGSIWAISWLCWVSSHVILNIGICIYGTCIVLLNVTWLLTQHNQEIAQMSPDPLPLCGCGLDTRLCVYMSWNGMELDHCIYIPVYVYIDVCTYRNGMRSGHRAFLWASVHWNVSLAISLIGRTECVGNSAIWLVDWHL